ncbi:hypothetical protein [Streptomyces sp. 1222.5]|uniref:hypothetical protein n=1 Tax=Streptomyces sp. 1222.5 TaxID=1881026 RepID=UPI003EC0FEB5
MRLVFVHGRAQGGSSSEETLEEWLKALERGCKRAGVRLPNSLDVRAPFYGKFLDEETAFGPGQAIVRGAEEGPDPDDARLLQELADRAGVTNAEISAELTDPVVARKPENWRWVIATGKALSKKAPWLTKKFIRRFTADVDAYLHWPHVRQGVNEIVAAELDGGPIVLVGHSLGSVVSYWTLTELNSPPPVPLMVTLGSPLGIDTIKNSLPRPLQKPASVDRWLNAADRRDFVALFSLDRDHFPAPIENLLDVKNPKNNRHGIAGYLRDQIVAEKIATTLALA